MLTSGAMRCPKAAAGSPRRSGHASVASSGTWRSGLSRGAPSSPCTARPSSSRHGVPARRWLTSSTSVSSASWRQMESISGKSVSTSFAAKVAKCPPSVTWPS
ncbi:MAG: hypothetical protein ACOZQL_27270 [Myxococcota bacterium]